MLFAESNMANLLCGREKNCTGCSRAAAKREGRFRFARCYTAPVPDRAGQTQVNFQGKSPDTPWAATGAEKELKA
jgi:hypothetical protein